MKKLHEVREALCHQFDELKTAKNGELVGAELEALCKITEAIKNLDKIEMMEKGGGYSHSGNWEADMRGSYANGGSYRGYSHDGGNMSGGSYNGSYGNGGSYGGRHRDSMGRFSSRAGGNEAMQEHLRAMMDEAPSERERKMIERWMNQLEQG